MQRKGKVYFIFNLIDLLAPDISFFQRIMILDFGEFSDPLRFQ